MDDRRVRLGELAAVGVTAVGFVALPKPPASVLPLAVFVPCCVVGWVGYGAARARRDRSLLDAWGLRPTAHLATLGPLVAVGIGVGAAGLAAIGLAGGSLRTPERLGLSLALYPVWGLVQQWIVQVLVVDNVRALTGAPLPALAALGAVGFGAVHLAHPSLVAATAALGAVYVLLFQRWRNLWPLALAHGWLGTLFYAWVLGFDPLAELLRGR